MLYDLEKLIQEIDPNNFQNLPRLISLIENYTDNITHILGKIKKRGTPIIGITGPPGAGKSTIVRGYIEILRSLGKSVGVLAVDPSSPFSSGSLLGDRIRMQNHTLDPGVFIRSLSSRGNLGGLSATTSDILSLLQGFNFDYILIETVGVGQSEIEIVGLANCVVVVLVPESGDEIQSFKSGILEIADVIVVNKSDRDGASKMTGILKEMLHERGSDQGLHNDEASNHHTSVLQTSAEIGQGIPELVKECDQQLTKISAERKIYRIMQQIQKILVREKMRNFDPTSVKKLLSKEMDKSDFNVYKFINDIPI